MVSEETYKLMQKGICPMCMCKIKKHSKHKAKVCKRNFAIAHLMKKPQMVELDENDNEISRKDIPFEAVRFSK